MTTANRPTWNSVRGGSEQGGNVLVKPSRQYSAKDMPSELKMKERAAGQGTVEEQKLIDFK
jgi:protein CWC15